MLVVLLRLLLFRAPDTSISISVAVFSAVDVFLKSCLTDFDCTRYNLLYYFFMLAVNFLVSLFL